MDNLKIEAVMKYAFGNMRVYVKNPEQADAIQTITGRKTLAPNVIKGLEKLGIEVSIVNPYE